MTRLTVKDAAAYVPCAKSTLDKLRTNGGGPIYIQMSSRKILYDTRDLDLWLESHKRKSTCDTGPRRQPTTATATAN